MTALNLRAKPAEHVDPALVRISKDVIELLTSGMYVSPVTIYREYIQNSADAIDEARGRRILSESDPGSVSIIIDHAARSVIIRDNGVGISRKEAIATLLSIGGSRKKGTSARGFRGVGRLSGLAYCRQLQFRTKAYGEAVETRLTWDCKGLRARLSEPTGVDDLRATLSEAVTVEEIPNEDVVASFFEVKLIDIARHRNDILLNEQLVAAYLSQVAPLDFCPSFSHSPAIVQALARHEAWQKPIELTINGTPVLRPFKDKMPIPGSSQAVEINHIEMIELTDFDGNVGAVGWIGHHQYVRSIPASLHVRGIRLRSGNVQVGEEYLVDDLFRESRFNSWSICEIHVIDRRLRPNARRDNFELNHHFYHLTAQLSVLTKRISSLCRSSSVQRAALAMIEGSIAEITSLLDAGELEQNVLSRSKARIERCLARLRAISDEPKRDELRVTLDGLRDRLSTVSVGASHRVVDFAEVSKLVTKFVTNRQQAKLLMEALERIGA